MPDADDIDDATSGEQLAEAPVVRIPFTAGAPTRRTSENLHAVTRQREDSRFVQVAAGHVAAG